MAGAIAATLCLASLSARRRSRFYANIAILKVVTRPKKDPQYKLVRPKRGIQRALRALLACRSLGMAIVGMRHDAAGGLYRLVDAAYQKRSIAVSSNLHPSGFDELMPKTLATATVGRLLHHAHACQTSGESIRLTQALAGQGVTPMN
ncbi:ATP-binding protein [Cryobacterium sp. PH31-L1]|nr:ATP-binding protein [Cryobacterium sp. PH31-L1]MDJ0378508.1 ATP-binding protein [Cryobacterium sp. PH31-L1]